MKIPKKKLNQLQITMHICTYWTKNTSKWTKPRRYELCALCIEHWALSIQTTIQFCEYNCQCQSICMSVSGKNTHCLPMHKLWLTIHINIAKCYTMFGAFFNAKECIRRCPFCFFVFFRNYNVSHSSYGILYLVGYCLSLFCLRYLFIHRIIYRSACSAFCWHFHCFHSEIIFHI